MEKPRPLPGLFFDSVSSVTDGEELIGNVDVVCFPRVRWFRGLTGFGCSLGYSGEGTWVAALSPVKAGILPCATKGRNRQQQGRWNWVVRKVQVVGVNQGRSGSFPFDKLRSG